MPTAPTLGTQRHHHTLRSLRARRLGDEAAAEGRHSQVGDPMPHDRRPLHPGLASWAVHFTGTGRAEARSHHRRFPSRAPPTPIAGDSDRRAERPGLPPSTDWTRYAPNNGVTRKVPTHEAAERRKGRARGIRGACLPRRRAFLFRSIILHRHSFVKYLSGILAKENGAVQLPRGIGPPTARSSVARRERTAAPATGRRHRRAESPS